MALIFFSKCFLKCCLQFVSIWISLNSFVIWLWINPLPHSRWFKLIAFAVDKVKVVKITNFVRNWVVTIVGNEENGVADWSKFIAFACNKSNVVKIEKIVLDCRENTVGKGDNAVTSIFSFSENVFEQIFSEARW